MLWVGSDVSNAWLSIGNRLGAAMAGVVDHVRLDLAPSY